MATFGDLRRYLDRAPGCALEPNLARGRRRAGDHVRYAKVLPDGSHLRTKVSRHPREGIGDDLFGHILHDQLRVAETEFWSVVRGQVVRVQGAPAADAPSAPGSPGLPGWLVVCLIEVAGLSESDVLAMTPQAARAAWDEFRSRPRDGGSSSPG